MNKFYIVANETKEGVSAIEEKIKAYIEEKGGAVCEESPKEADCILVIGGDGTLLRATRKYSEYGKPFLGVNMGSLGFLTTIEASDVCKAMDALFANDLRIEERVQINCKAAGKASITALNDVVVKGGSYSHLIGITVYVNDQKFCAYECDGIIISTATGSTGYNLSAGGPIVTPNVNAIIVTPVCPHAFNARSFVISGDDKVRVKLEGVRHKEIEPAFVTVDGYDYAEIEMNDEIEVEKSAMTCKMIVLPTSSFIDTLNYKLM